MKLGIIHLSDIHFRKGRFDYSSDEDMVRKISAAVRPELIGATHVLLIISGDIAFAGDEEEYNYASDWFSDLYTQIDDGCEAECWIIFAPGNHDVNHDENRSVRSALVSQIESKHCLALEEDIIDQCTIGQSSFFSFRDNLEAKNILVFSDSLFRIHRIRDEKSIVQINVLNSAWMSSIKEQQGSLIFPIKKYQEQLKRPDGFSISVMHHPFSWYTTECSRKMQEKLTLSSSLVLLGHEHISRDIHLYNRIGDHVRIIDGGVLHEQDNDNSSFNLIFLETTENKIKSLIYKLSGGGYVVDDDSDWQDATRLNSYESVRFRIKKNEREKMEDIGLNILHPRKEQLSLKDIFVYPDLLPLNSDDSKNKSKIDRMVSAETLIFNEIPLSLLEGDESYGKSALLRMFFLEFHQQRGKIPLYVQAKGKKIWDGGADQFRKILKNTFDNTYEGDTFTQYEQLDPSERVLLIDDFELGNMDIEEQEEFFNFVKSYSSKCVVITKDFLALEQNRTTKKGSSVLKEIDIYLLQEHGHAKRDELIKRWILLGRNSREWNTESTLNERQRVRLVINTTLGKNLIPSLPVFLLVILQSTETAAANSIGSTYGHYYHYLITKTLMESGGVRAEDLDAFSNYLSELAFSQYYLLDRKEIPENEFKKWHETFCENFGVNWPSERIFKKLIRANILKLEVTGKIYFKYQYVYYFFLAKRLANEISEEEIRKKISHMCDRLHIDEYSKIILFIIHHSSDKYVLQRIRKSAGSLLKGQPLFNLEANPENTLLSIVNRLPSPIGTIPIDGNRNPDDEQKKILKAKDAIEGSDREEEFTFEQDKKMKDQSMDGLHILTQANVAAKIVELIGQILRNYYGSLRIQTKTDLGNDAIELALRSLYSFVNLIISDNYEVVDILVEVRKEYERENLTPKERKDDKELERWARDWTFAILRTVAVAIITKVASSLGAEQLKPTLERLVPNKAALAYKMVEIAILLDNPSSIPKDKISAIVSNCKNNPLSFQILQEITAQRVYRYPINYQDKQWLADKLNFSLVRQRTADRDKSRRLLPQ